MAGPSTWGYQVLGFGAGTPLAAAVTTTKFQVRLFDFDSDDGCACTLSSTYQVWENDSSSALGGADLTLSVSDVIGGYNVVTGGLCVQVTAINAAGTAVGYTESNYTDCSDCNDLMTICEEGGGGGPPGGGFGKCLLPDMLVKLIDGSLAKVMDLNLGDLIESPYGFTEVSEMMKDHPRDGYYIIEDELYISNDHPILVDGKMVRAEDYTGNKQYVEALTNTVYVGTVAPTFNVYCENNVYVVDGQY